MLAHLLLLPRGLPPRAGQSGDANRDTQCASRYICLIVPGGSTTYGSTDKVPPSRRCCCWLLQLIAAARCRHFSTPALGVRVCTREPWGSPKCIHPCPCRLRPLSPPSRNPGANTTRLRREGTVHFPCMTKLRLGYSAGLLPYCGYGGCHFVLLQTQSALGIVDCGLASLQKQF